MRLCLVLALGPAVGACAMPLDEAPEEVSDGAATLAVYQIEPGDVLGSVARRYGVTVGALIAENGIERPDHIRAGASLVIPTVAMAARGRDPADEGLRPYRPPAGITGGIVPCTADRAVGSREECAYVDHTWACLSPYGSGSDAVDIVAADGRRQRVVIDPDDEDGHGEIEASAVDLDGDGTRELVVTALSAWGRWATTWEVMVFADRTAPPVRFEVNEWGPGSLVRSDAGGCDVLATDWEWVTDLRRGPGLYFVGRRLVWTGERMMVMPGPRARRLTTWFMEDDEGDDEAAESVPGNHFRGHPGEWLSDPRTQIWTGEPHREGRAISEDTGVVIGFDDEPDGWVLDIDIGGGPERYSTHACACDWDTTPGIPLEAVGFRADGVLLPRSYHPATVDDWIGRSVIIEHRVDWDDGHELPVLVWLDDKTQPLRSQP